MIDYCKKIKEKKQRKRLQEKIKELQKYLQGLQMLLNSRIEKKSEASFVLGFKGTKKMLDVFSKNKTTLPHKIIFNINRGNKKIIAIDVKLKADPLIIKSEIEKLGRNTRKGVTYTYHYLNEEVDEGLNTQRS